MTNNKEEKAEEMGGERERIDGVERAGEGDGE